MISSKVMRAAGSLISQFVSDLKSIGLISDAQKSAKNVDFGDIDFDFSDLSWHQSLGSFCGTPPFFDSFSTNSRVSLDNFWKTFVLQFLCRLF